MSGANQAEPRPRMANRGIVIAPLAFGETFGDPFGDRAYVTSRFPSGIKKSHLFKQDAGTVRETIMFWFLRNYEPGTEPEPSPVLANMMGRQPYSSMNARTDPPTVQAIANAHAVAGTAEQLVRQDFDAPFLEDRLVELATLLPGWWTLKPELNLPTSGTQDELRATLLSLLDEFDQGVRDLPGASLSRWHNSPPERLDDSPAPLSPAEKDTTLRATASMRLALASYDFLGAGEAWVKVSPVLGKVGEYILSLADTYLKELAKKAAGWTVPAAVVYYELAHGVLDKGDAIKAILNLLGVDTN